MRDGDDVAALVGAAASVEGGEQLLRRVVVQRVERSVGHVLVGDDHVAMQGRAVIGVGPLVGEEGGEVAAVVGRPRRVLLGLPGGARHLQAIGRALAVAAGRAERLDLQKALREGEQRRAVVLAGRRVVIGALGLAERAVERREVGVLAAAVGGGQPLAVVGDRGEIEGAPLGQLRHLAGGDLPADADRDRSSTGEGVGVERGGSIAELVGVDAVGGVHVQIAPVDVLLRIVIGTGGERGVRRVIGGGSLVHIHRPVPGGRLGVDPRWRAVHGRGRRLRRAGG